MAFTFQRFVTSVTRVHFLTCGSPQILLLTELFPIFYREITFSSLTVAVHASFGPFISP